ncbi:competence protein ComGA [Enterococcus sp. PF1-24]|uniref:competence type IV pilus ATPase ComGA n=1 Tax=unclassified Enterococcus TaxID=2608891 RepID=UPI002473DF6C|nr:MULTISPECIES: competence type IV pilus ATPase ComGA [unclassified Enterococcus]MDH6365556.1 competence protein ComGA [Enterococcus sp. PFB1-1]MDH6402654.1 competence protein ComGA [Enterococcus sp. PF1-24]
MDVEKFSKLLIQKGSEKNWQDIYILPEGEGYKVYYRIGGQRLFLQKLLSSEAQQLISRFKYLGRMDVGEKRKAQLGAITYGINGERLRLRLSTVGDYLQRESLVIRLLFQFGNQKASYALKAQPQKIAQYLTRRGLYLFSGPVGSGKTTLMYKLAKTFSGQIITIEDPVEIEEPAFLQLQTNDKIAQDYDALIRLSLRHHPDVLIIGEIRDEATAKAAIRSALTGHYVFATIHARELASVEARLLELGQSHSEISECLQGVIYQEMLMIQEKPQVLCAYRFYQGADVLTELTWAQGLAQLAEQLGALC